MGEVTQPDRHRSSDKCTTHLRRVAYYVDEPEKGEFYWVMIESLDDATVWIETKCSVNSYSTWQAALDAGNEALQDIVTNPDVGPRAPGEDENANPVGD
jgi:hypothetical protein